MERLKMEDEVILEFYKYINKKENEQLAYSKGILKSLVEEILRLKGLQIYINMSEEDII
jgi:hypothetical protein